MPVEAAPAIALPARPIPLAVVLLMVTLCACWGLAQVAIKVAGHGISPVFQSALRSAGSAVLVVGWCAFRRVPLFERDGTLIPGIVAGLMFGAEFVLIYIGIQYTEVSRGTLLLYMSPFVVAVGNHLFVPGDRLSAAKLAGMTVAFGGLLLVFAGDLGLPTAGQLAGDAMFALAAVVWGATTVVVKATRLSRARAEKTLLYQLAVSAAMLFAFAALRGEPGLYAPSPLVLLAIGYQIVIVAFVTYVAWFWLISIYPASKLASFTFLTPAFAVLFGGLLLDEPVTPLILAALALITAGIWLVNRPSAT